MKSTCAQPYQTNIHMCRDTFVNTKFFFNFKICRLHTKLRDLVGIFFTEISILTRKLTGTLIRKILKLCNSKYSPSCFNLAKIKKGEILQRVDGISFVIVI